MLGMMVDEPTSSGRARQLLAPPCRLEGCSNRLFTLTPMGLELEENTLYLGYGSHLRAAASVGFPRELPLPEGAPIFHPRVHRLGIKAKW